MTTAIATQSEYRDLPLAQLQESSVNPRRAFDDVALQELADYVPRHISGVLWRSPFRGRGDEGPHEVRQLLTVRGT